MAVDQERLEALMGKVIDDLGAALDVGLISLGERAGLWAAMAGAGPLTSAGLAGQAGVEERYAREWLRAMAAGGYVDYDPGADAYSISDEVAFAMAAPDGPTVPGAAQVALAVLDAVPHVAQRFRSGDGFGWHEHHHDLFEGTERFFRPQYAMHLVEEWLPALDGVEATLRRGGRVADVGCGHGASTILMAQAYPGSRFTGFDFHGPSIEHARAAARAAEVDDRVDFQVAPADGFPGSSYDLVAMFDCLHDMGDPVAVARHVRGALDGGGAWMIVEPAAGDRVEDNLTPVGRVFYAASTLICTPASLAQPGRAALGAQAGEAALSEVARAGGFSRVRRAAETPVNIVLEARP
ncbi:class I SAM-dependent methyltransferase [Miltoncostaea marina]|uniref:class I SAM-dependent methyltransferase n=1 Tax=Miltoncostaea marina TaxID=2843215 RepID=UPI001C3D83B0|nr:class I SAM-dependent methyltransferase [Miltoncostaea marina]